MSCEHPRQQKITTYGGGIYARRCPSCLAVFALRSCGDCGAEMLIRERDHGKRYCSPRHRQNARNRRRRAAKP